MDLPQPRRPYRAVPTHADYTNHNDFGVGGHSGTGRASGYAPVMSSGTLRDEDMERVAAAVTVTKRIAGASDMVRLSPALRGAGSPAIALASDMRMLGVGTSMRGSGVSEASTGAGSSTRGGPSSGGIEMGSRSAAGAPAHGVDAPVEGVAGAPSRRPAVVATSATMDAVDSSAFVAPESTVTSLANKAQSAPTSAWNGAQNMGVYAGPPVGAGVASLAAASFATSKPIPAKDRRRGDLPIHVNGEKNAPELPSPAFAEPTPCAAVLSSVEAWDGVKLARGGGGGVSGRL